MKIKYYSRKASLAVLCLSFTFITGFGLGDIGGVINQVVPKQQSAPQQPKRQYKKSSSRLTGPCSKHRRAMRKNTNFFEQALFKGMNKALAGSSSSGGGLLGGLAGTVGEAVGGITDVAGDAVGGIGKLAGGYLGSMGGNNPFQIMSHILKDISKDAKNLNSMHGSMVKTRECRIREINKIKADMKAGKITRAQANKKVRRIVKQYKEDDRKVQQALKKSRTRRKTYTSAQSEAAKKKGATGNKTQRKNSQIAKKTKESEKADKRIEEERRKEQEMLAATLEDGDWDTDDLMAMYRGVQTRSFT